MTGSVKYYDPGLSEVIINTSASGDVTLVSASTGLVVCMYRVFFVAGGTTSVTFKDGSTGLTGAIPMVANGSFVLDFNFDPWFTGTAGNAFILNNLSAVQLSGRMYYTQHLPSQITGGLPAF